MTERIGADIHSAARNVERKPQAAVWMGGRGTAAASAVVIGELTKLQQFLETREWVIQEDTVAVVR